MINLIVGFSLVAGATLFLLPAAPGDKITSQFGNGNGNVSVGGVKSWIKDEEGHFVRSAEPNRGDPNQYDYIFACQVDEQSLHAACPDSQERCPPREDGTQGNLVVWRSAPRAIANPTWTEWTSMGGPTCLYDAQPEDLLPRIAARILQDFRDLPVAAGILTAQPSPHTLVGAETNVFANAAEQQFDVTILGQQVHLTATPAQYTFNYGDGTILGPGASHGGPIPEADWGTRTRTSHVYSDTGNFGVTVTTSFTGTYSVNNGPALPITGTGEFTSAPQTLQVWRSVTRNYADDCNANPLGEGCRTR